MDFTERKTRENPDENHCFIKEKSNNFRLMIMTKTYSIYLPKTQNSNYNRNLLQIDLNNSNLILVEKLVNR